MLADTKNPAVVVPPWEDYNAKYKRFETTSDSAGNFALFVDTGTYYLMVAFPGSTYYTLSTFGGNLITSSTTSIGAGRSVSRDLTVVDWSIDLVAPGVSSSTWYSTSDGPEKYSETTPTFRWNPYSWDRYDGNAGYYVLEVGMIDDGYKVVFKQKVAGANYTPFQPLVGGKEHRWKVMVYSKDGDEIGGTVEDLEFIRK